MPLIDCIPKIKNLSDQDSAFLFKELSDGKTDEQALDTLGQTIQDEVDSLVAALEADGIQVERAGVLTTAEKAQAAEDRKWVGWKPETTKAGKIKGAPQWVNDSKDPRKALGEMERKLLRHIDEGLTGRNWYEESAQRILDIVRGDLKEAERLIQVIAIYSPQANVQVNTGFAVTAWNQYKRGEQIQVKTGEQDAKAAAVLYDNLPYEGRKTNSFYQNLMYDLVKQNPEAVDQLSLDQEVVDSLDKPATIDLWMFRAFEFENESAGDDKGGGAYSFSENYVRRLTAKMNNRVKRGQPRWTPHQVQASIWTAMKARYETPWVKEKTWAESLDKGIAKIVDGKRTLPTTADGQRKHNKIWAKHARSMKAEEASEAAIETAASYETFIDQMLQTVTWETMPSTKLGQAINGASPEVKQQFMREALAIIINADGSDSLAERLGVPLGFVRRSRGAYAGGVEENALSFLLPEKQPGGKGFSYAEVRTYARAIQYIFKQDAVPWFRADSRALTSKKARQDQKFRVINTKTGKMVPKSRVDTLAEADAIAKGKGAGFRVQGGKYQRSVALQFDGNISPTQAEDVLHLLESVFGNSAGYTQTAPNEISVINFRDDETGVPFLDDDVFLAGLSDIEAGLVDIGMNDLAGFWSEGEYGHEQNWESDPAGQAILDERSLARRPDLQAWVRDRRQAFEKVLDRYTEDSIPQRQAETQEITYLAQGGPAPAGPKPQPFDTAYPHEVVKISDIKGIEHAHAPDRAIRFLQEVIDGTGEQRRPPSVRRDADGTYTVLDGRSAVTAAIHHGYTEIPVRVIDDVRDEDTREVVEVTPELEAVYMLGARAKDRLDKKMEAIAEKLGGVWKDTPLKGRRRTMHKVYDKNEYDGDLSKLKDIVRGTMSVNTIKDALYIRGIIVEEFGFRTVIKDKVNLDQFVNFNMTGYRDINMVFEVDGFPVEVQINARDNLVAKSYGEQLYTAYRELDKVKDARQIRDLVEIEQKLYRDSYRLSKGGAKVPGTLKAALNVVKARVQDVERINARYGLDINFEKSNLEILLPLWSADAKLKFRGGSVSHAKQVIGSSPDAMSSVTGIPSTSISSAVGPSVSNVGTVILDTSTPSIAESRALLQQEKGRFFPDVSGKRIIQLTEASDLSTFLHESSHMFLDVQQMWAEKYGMNDNQRAMLSWLGAGSFAEITDEQHETWAETFEVYLREGKAPSVGLRRAFQSFSSWLKRIYRSLSDPRIGRAKLAPEITEIFDRMLATEAEIDAAKLAPEYAELFQSQEQAGMNDIDWARYQKIAERKNETAEMTLDAKVMAQYKKMKSSDWRREKAPLIEQEKERLGQEPAYKLIAEMSTEGGRVDWHKLRDAIGGWPNGKNWIGKAVGGGVDPGLLSDKYGYPSVKAMYEDIKNTPTLKQASEAAAEKTMIEKHGDILNDGTLETEVREAMLNDDQAELLLMELKAEGKTRTQGIDRKTLKFQAEQLIAGMPFKKIRPSKFYNQMIKAAQAAAKAEDPTPHKIQQLANHYLYKAAMEAKEQMVKDRKKIRATQTQKFQPGKVDQEYFEAMKNLALAYDMRLTPVERMDRAKRVLDFYEGQNTQFDEETSTDTSQAALIGLDLLDLNLVAAIRFRSENKTLEGFELKVFDQMTAEEIAGVVDMIKHLRYVGGQVADKGSLEAAALKDAGLEAIEAEGGKDFPVQRGKVRTGKGLRLTWGDFVASMPSLGNMIRKMDGFKDGGWTFENILKPIQQAIDTKMTMQLEMFKQMEGFMAEMPSVGLRDNDAMPYTKEDGTEDDYTSSELFMMAVYWGTESSREALMQGHQLSENDVIELMSRLTPPQLALVNQVWAMNETQWPKLQAAAKEMLGVAPPKLMATPFNVNGVKMTGGHMQLMYDSQALELADEAMRGMNTANVVPMQAGSTHARKGSGGRPILLDTQNITQSMEEKTHYIAFATVGRHLRGIVNNKAIQNMIEKKHGAPFYQNLIHSIGAITQAIPARETSRWMARMSRWMRQSATLMHLGYSLRNVMQQFPAALISAREVGTIKFIQASARFGADPMAMMKVINEKSAKMQNRAQLVNRESRETMKKILATTRWEKTWHGFKTSAFFLQTMVDSAVAYPTWYAKYNDSIEKHGDEARAVIEADTVVAETVGSGHDAFLGRIMQSNQNEFVKTLTIFGSWFNAYYQRLYKSSKGGTDFLSGAFLMDGIIMPIIVANLTQLVIGDWPDEDEEVEEYILKNSLKFLIATIPVMRDMASVYEGFSPSTPLSAVVVAPFRIKSEIESFAAGRQTGLKLAADVGRAVGSVTKLPGSGNIFRFMEYSDSYMQGKEGDIFNPYLAFTEGADKDK